MRTSATIYCAALATVCAMSAPRGARAQASPVLVQAEPPRPFGLELSAGGRTERFGGAGYQAFSDDRWMAETALAAGYRVAGGPEAGLAVGAAWNHGRASSTARGIDSTLDLDRLCVSVAARRSLWRRLSVFARLAPGVVRLNAALSDSSVLNANQYGNDASLSQTHWAMALEAAAGAAFRVGQLARPGERVMALWLTAEGGYGFAGSTALALSSKQGAAPARTEAPVRLGTVTPGGVFMNFAAALTF